MSASPPGTLSRSGSHAIDEHAVPPYVHDAGLLLLRLLLGLTMASHGAQKLFGWFSGVGLDGAGRVFTSVGYPAGKAMAVLAGLSEVLGGVGLALGLLTPLAAAAVVGVMVNAVALKWGGGFFAPAGVEYELLIAAVAVTLAVAGPGRLALDPHLPGVRTHRVGNGVAAVVLGVLLGAIVLLFRG
ncbi:DoxX family membrane protein [Actinacidiphila sp. bgisy160]|uniref:DoxX family membrane protein n=1 Tax=Actinacidiphila sp. bgisy160 TaxID=3413796 RepID=UPI003D716419